MADEKKVELVKVKGTGDDNRVVLFERDKSHPNGECFIVNDGQTYEVANTKMVKQLIGESRLELSTDAPKVLTPKRRRAVPSTEPVTLESEPAMNPEVDEDEEPIKVKRKAFNI